MLGCLNPGCVVAQAVAGGAEVDRPPADSEGESSGNGGNAIFGHAPAHRRIIPGLFAMHPYDHDFPEVDWVGGGGLQVSGWFIAGFINSYDRFSVMAGIERNWLERRAGALEFGVGYRAGLLSGYDERLLDIARDVPVLPVVGLLVWFDLGPVGFDAFYVFRALVLEASLGF